MIEFNNQALYTLDVLRLEAWQTSPAWFSLWYHHQQIISELRLQGWIKKYIIWYYRKFGINADYCSQFWYCYLSFTMLASNLSSGHLCDYKLPKRIIIACFLFHVQQERGKKSHNSLVHEECHILRRII